MKISRDFSLQSSLLICTGYETLKLWVENLILQLEKTKMIELVSFEEVASKTKTGSGTTQRWQRNGNKMELVCYQFAIEWGQVSI